MANLRRPSKDNMVGRFNLHSCCKKHPKHVQSPGVCSLCLKDKLSQLASSSTSQKTSSAAVDSSCSSSSSLSSYHSSSSVSSCASPSMHFSREEKTSGSSVSIFLFPKNNGLVKSRSMSVIPRRRKKEIGEADVGDGKKSGFWFKLFHPKSKRKEDKVVRARSLREALNVAN